MSLKAWEYYDSFGENYFERYESLAFSRTHRAFLTYLPKRKGSCCLDIGAGSGRDAAALARRGYQVTAVEPSLKMRQFAKMRHPGLGIHWVDDHLPGLLKVKEEGGRFDFILLSAVWMHIAPHDRIPAMTTLRELLSSGGYIGMTLRLGPVAADREMFPVSDAEIAELAEACRLQIVFKSRSNRDSLSRNDVKWKKVVLTSS